MKVNKVTITGADDSTDIKWMAELSQQFPFVEWAILVSASQTGNPRFPSTSWMHGLHEISIVTPMQLSLHVCGQWVREICAGDWDSLINTYDGIIQDYKRIQLNFHAYEHLLNDQFYDEALQQSADNGWQLIFQVDGINDHLVSKARDKGIDAIPLFDLSGGAGIVPDTWPIQKSGVYSGYAGGLGPMNVLDELEKITEVAKPNETIWIDMETKVRTFDNMQLDKNAVESVLVQMDHSQYLHTE